MINLRTGLLIIITPDLHMTVDFELILVRPAEMKNLYIW